MATKKKQKAAAAPAAREEQESEAELERQATVSQALADAGVVEVNKKDQDKILAILGKHADGLLPIQLARELKLSLDSATAVIKILRQRGLIVSDNVGARAKWKLAPKMRTSAGLDSTTAKKTASGGTSAMRERARAEGVEVEDLALLEAAEEALRVGSAEDPPKRAKADKPKKKAKR